MVVVLVASVAGLAIFINAQMPDQDSEDYRRRVEFLWSGAMPHVPSAAESVRVESSKHPLVRLAQRYFALPDNKPYLVAYPLEQSLAPAVIIAPGGAYVGRAEGHEGVEVARWLNSIGVAAFVLNYRLDRHPAPLSDAQRAIQFVRANAARFRIDPARVGILGFSAGGHLAATAGTHVLPGDPQADDPVARFSSRPDFMVLGYPVISFGRWGHAMSREMLLGPNPAPELIDELSIERQVSADTPPTFIWAPKTDGAVDYRNAEVFAEALAAHGVPVEFHLFPEGAHGSGLAQDEEHATVWPRRCQQWMEDMGFYLPEIP